jgi:hypothetical protein
LQEPESLADLSVWLSVRERPVDARNGPDRGKLVGRCLRCLAYVDVGVPFLRATSPGRADIVASRLMKEKMIVDCGIVEIPYSFITVLHLSLLSCGNCGDTSLQQRVSQGRFPQFHKSTTLSSVPTPSPSAVSRDRHGER